MDGVKERGVIIRGTSKSVATAFKLIMLRLQSQGTGIRGGTDSEGDNALIQWSIPQSSAGLLIGKQGAGIKHINERSGCWVKIAHPEESITKGERLVYIRGPKDKTDIALEIVKKGAVGHAVTTEDDEAISFSQALSVPTRARDIVCKGFIFKNETDTDFDNIMDAFASVRVDVDHNCFSGLSETRVIVHCEEPEARIEAVKLIEKRVREWEHSYSSPEVTPRDEEGILDSTVNMSKEMNVVILLSHDACREFLFPEAVDQSSANIFTGVLNKYKCMMKMTCLITIGKARKSLRDRRESL